MSTEYDEQKFWEYFDEFALLLRTCDGDNLDVQLENLKSYIASRMTRNSSIQSHTDKAITSVLERIDTRIDEESHSDDTRWSPGAIKAIIQSELNKLIHKEGE